MKPSRVCCAVALYWVPAVTLAHGWGGRNTPLYDGMLHMLLNPAYILPLAGMALLASRGGREWLAQAQLLLATGVAAGAALGSFGLNWSGAVFASRLYIVAAGLLVALAVHLPRQLVLAGVLLGGILAGHELLVSEPPAGNPLWFCLGAMLGAMVLQGGVGGLAMAARAPWALIAVRIAGSWIAATGIIFAGFLLIPAR